MQCYLPSASADPGLALRIDPQLTKYQSPPRLSSTASNSILMHTDMYTHRYRYFRFTPRTAWITFVYVAVVPGILIYTAKQFDVGLPYRLALGTQSTRH